MTPFAKAAASSVVRTCEPQTRAERSPLGRLGQAPRDARRRRVVGGERDADRID